MDTRAQVRTVDGGDVPIEVNSHSMTSGRYVDRSRLREECSEEYAPATAPGRPGRYTTSCSQASIEDAARAGADAMKHRSSFRDVNKLETVREYGGCYPSPFYGSNGPLTTKRGDR